MTTESRKPANDQLQASDVPAGFVPTPSESYRAHRKLARLTKEPAAAAPGPFPIPTPIPIPSPIPFIFGSRVLMWKQDPSVTEIGIRKAYLPGLTSTGPRDSRIVSGSPGIPAVSPNALGDFIVAPNTDEFDAVHTFTVVRQTLTMYQRALASGSSAAPLPWQWNSASNTEALKVFPHGLPNTMNAFYARSEKSLKFGDFVPNGSTARVFTCRSLDIVSHETGHAVLDGLKPGWLLASNPPQTGGLHESFGDMTAIFLTLSQLDQAEAVIAQTKGNLHDKTFLADMAEQFGLALGRPNGLRNADNDLKLSEVGNEVHAISQVFTGAIYDILADIFAFDRKPSLKDDAVVLHDTGAYLCSLVLRAIIASPATAATFAHVANNMLTIANSDGKPVQYRNFIRNRFNLREVIVSPTPLTANHVAGPMLAAHITDQPGAMQDRRTCCGTMTLHEHSGGIDALNKEIEEFQKAMQAHPRG